MKFDTWLWVVVTEAVLSITPGPAVLLWIGAAYLVSATDSDWRIWIDAFLLQGANPKALLFFTAILPQFIAHELFDCAAGFDP